MITLNLAINFNYTEALMSSSVYRFCLLMEEVRGQTKRQLGLRPNVIDLKIFKDYFASQKIGIRHGFDPDESGFRYTQTDETDKNGSESAKE